MVSVNKVILIGNLGKDPEIRYSPDGGAMANFSIACTESWKDKATGEKKEHTEWIRISIFGRLAEIAGEYLKKGSSVYVEGRIRTRKWTDKEGQERYTTEIIADRMQMLGAKPGGERGATQSPEKKPEPKRAPDKGSGGHAFSDMDDDIPF